MEIKYIILICIYMFIGVLIHGFTTPSLVLWKFKEYDEELSTSLWTDMFLWLPILFISILVNIYYRLRR